MALTKFERGTSWKSTVTYTSSNTNVDCSGNMTFLTVYNPDATVGFGPVSGVHQETGIYHQYPSTSTTSDLGIYVEEWKTFFSYGTGLGWRPKYDREAIQICHVKQG